MGRVPHVNHPCAQVRCRCDLQGARVVSPRVNPPDETAWKRENTVAETIIPTIPVLETARLILRGAVLADADVWAPFLDDPDFTRYVPRSKVRRPLQERAERMMRIYQQRWEAEPLSAMGWAVTRKADGQFMGLCGVEALEGTNDGELDYLLGKPYWGQGYATEAARATVRFAFEHTQWERVVAAIVPANIASNRVLDHLGFVYEKHVNYYELTGADSIELDDPVVALYALPREQFQARGAAV